MSTKQHQRLSELPDVLTVHETAVILRVSGDAAYQAIRKNEIPSIRIGRRLLVPKARLRLLLGDPTQPLPAAVPPSMPPPSGDYVVRVSFRSVAPRRRDDGGSKVELKSGHFDPVIGKLKARSPR